MDAIVARFLRTLVLVSVVLGVWSATLAQQETTRIAYDSGYSDGFESGKRDRGEKRPFDFANQPAYQNAQRGFDEQVHDRDVYTGAYRRGFEDGYEVGYGLGRNLRAVPSPPPSQAEHGIPRNGL